MAAYEALLDTNVIVAGLDQDHLHHKPSLRLFESAASRRFCVAAHSFAEAYVTLTRRGDHGPFRWPPDEALAALESVATITHLIGPTPTQQLDFVRSYAATGGIGPRLYDYLIGRAAVQARAFAIVTWNTRHLRVLFPDRQVHTPEEFLDRTGMGEFRTE